MNNPTIMDRTERSTGALLVPISSLIWHEQCEPGRLARLRHSFQHEPLRESIHISSGVNPVILDGAHRTKAAQSLGFTMIPAHIVPIAADERVQGWTHIYHADSNIIIDCQQQTGNNGPVIATVSYRGKHREIRAHTDAIADLHSAYTSLAEMFARHVYKRTLAVDEDNISLHWRLPSWGTVEAIVRNYGPLPAGVTRLADIFTAKCTACRSVNADLGLGTELALR